MLTPVQTGLSERASPARQRMTLDEFFALPEGPPYYEFEQGDLIPMPRPHGRHQDIIMAIGAELRSHIIKEKLGRMWPEIEVNLPGENRVYVPDLVFLAAGHVERFSDADGRIHGVPDLVVEVLSPGAERRDRTVKLRAYQRAGVPWYWMVHSGDLWIEEYRLTFEGYVLAQSVPPGEPFLPGLFPALAIDLAALLGQASEM